MSVNWSFENRKILTTLVLHPLATRAALCDTVVSQSVFASATLVLNPRMSRMTLSNENNTDRSNGFQILADGTQDLAALVGLFATDGVERYTIDYTRGFLPPVTAPLSLLGLLGYVRALLKLSLGIDFCERTGFSTTSLRSYVGIRHRDVPQNERFTKVHYLERAIRDSSVEWRVVKTTLHSQESMPLTAGGGKRAWRDRRAYDPSMSINTCCLKENDSTACLALWMCGSSLILTAGLSSFMILLFTAPWTWTRFFACVGLPGSILMGGMPWCWVYMTEHLPFEPSDWYRSDWKDGVSRVPRAADVRGASLMRKNSFAYFANDDHFYIFDCRAVSIMAIRIIRATSFCAAVCITVAYICQYIELRCASGTESGIWLGIQGLLAMVRILAWNWAPKPLGFSTEPLIRRTDQRDKNFKDSLTELEIILCWSSTQKNALDAVWEKEAHAEAESSNAVQTLSLPKWLIGRIDNLKPTEAFSLWNRVRSGVAIGNDFYQIRDASVHWDMPDTIFARWLQLRCRKYGRSLTYTASKRRMGVGAWVCRIIADKNGNLHLIPGISLHVYPENRTVSPSGEMIIFSCCTNPERNILCFPRSHANGTERLYQGIEALPDDYRGMPWLAKRALEPFYQQIVDELWVEMLSALRVLGFFEA